MGWRGAVRSINAANRRARIASDRRARAVAKLRSAAASNLNSIDAEVQKEIQRFEKYDDDIRSGPVKTLNLKHQPAQGWTTSEIKDQTGKITYNVMYGPPSQDALFDPPSVSLRASQSRPSRSACRSTAPRLPLRRAVMRLRAEEA